MNIKKCFLIIVALLIQACAVTPVGPSCETFTGEALAACKAEEKCKSKKSSYGVQLTAPSAANLGMSPTETKNTTNYTSCIDAELAPQRGEEVINPQIKH